MKVVNILRYPIMAGGRIDKSREPDVIRKGAVVNERYIERINSNTEQNGMHIVIDTKATEQYEIDAKAINEERAKKADLKNALAGTAIAEALGIQKPAPKPRRKKTKKEETK